MLIKENSIKLSNSKIPDLKQCLKSFGLSIGGVSTIATLSDKIKYELEHPQNNLGRVKHLRSFHSHTRNKTIINLAVMYKQTGSNKTNI